MGTNKKDLRITGGDISNLMDEAEVGTLDFLGHVEIKRTSFLGEGFELEGESGRYSFKAGKDASYLGRLAKCLRENGYFLANAKFEYQSNIGDTRGFGDLYKSR